MDGQLAIKLEDGAELLADLAAIPQRDEHTDQTHHNPVARPAARALPAEQLSLTKAPGVSTCTCITSEDDEWRPDCDEELAPGETAEDSGAYITGDDDEWLPHQREHKSKRRRRRYSQFKGATILPNPESGRKPTPEHRIAMDALVAERKARGEQSSPYAGVVYDMSVGKFFADIKHDHIVHKLGWFIEEADAAKAFDTAARMLRGNRAHGGRSDNGAVLRLNFPTVSSTNFQIQLRYISSKRETLGAGGGAV